MEINAIVKWKKNVIIFYTDILFILTKLMTFSVLTEAKKTITMEHTLKKLLILLPHMIHSMEYILSTHWKMVDFIVY